MDIGKLLPVQLIEHGALICSGRDVTLECNAPAEAMIRAEGEKLGIEARSFTDEEIVERVIYPLINEGALILDEGIAQRASDIDIVYLYGYGFPAHRGGPMFYGSMVGTDAVYRKLCAFRDTLGRPDDWPVAPLLERLAAEGKGF
mgnify:CR=1 FL=1